MAAVEDFYAAIRKGDRRQVERLAAADPGLVNAPLPDNPATYGNVSPLSTAVRTESVEMVKTLLRLGAEPDRIQPPFNSTPLLGAARGRLKLLDLLLAAGADPNLANESGTTPLMCAAMDDDPADRLAATRRLLKAGADPRAGKNGGPLRNAVQAGDVKLIEALIAAGADLASFKLPDLLFEAVRYDRAASATWLLGKGADPAVPVGAGKDPGLNAVELAEKLGSKKALAALRAPAGDKKPKKPARLADWAAIKAALKADHPDLFKTFRKPAAEAALARVEKLVGRPLPDAVRAFYLANDGQADDADVTLIQPPGRFDEGYLFLSLEGATRAWKMMKELVDGGDFADQSGSPGRGVKADWWSVGWLPVATDGGGDYFCVDLDPARGGAVGQVVHFRHDGPERKLAAKGFDAWLAAEYRRFLKAADG